MIFSTLDDSPEDADYRAKRRHFFSLIRRGTILVAAHVGISPEKVPPTQYTVQSHRDLFGIGSGFVVDDRGVIVTAAHVVTDFLQRRTQVSALELLPTDVRYPYVVADLETVPTGFDLPPGTEIGQNETDPEVMAHVGSGATLVARVAIASSVVRVQKYLLDPVLDIALLFVRPGFFPRVGTAVHPLPLAFKDPEPGDEIVLCGYPVGERKHADLRLTPISTPSLATGIVSAVLPGPDALDAFRSMFDFSAPSLKGNSGSPVCDFITGGVLGVASDVVVRNGVEVGYPRAVTVSRVKALLSRAFADPAALGIF